MLNKFTFKICLLSILFYTVCIPFDDVSDAQIVRMHNLLFSNTFIDTLSIYRVVRGQPLAMEIIDPDGTTRPIDSINTEGYVRAIRQLFPVVSNRTEFNNLIFKIDLLSELRQRLRIKLPFPDAKISGAMDMGDVFSYGLDAGKATARYVLETVFKMAPDPEHQAHMQQTTLIKNLYDQTVAALKKRNRYDTVWKRTQFKLNLPFDAYNVPEPNPSLSRQDRQLYRNIKTYFAHQSKLKSISTVLNAAIIAIRVDDQTVDAKPLQLSHDLIKTPAAASEYKPLFQWTITVDSEKLELKNNVEVKYDFARNFINLTFEKGFQFSRVPLASYDMGNQPSCCNFLATNLLDVERRKVLGGKVHAVPFLKNFIFSLIADVRGKSDFLSVAAIYRPTLPDPQLPAIAQYVTSFNGLVERNTFTEYYAENQACIQQLFLICPQAVTDMTYGLPGAPRPRHATAINVFQRIKLDLRNYIAGKMQRYGFSEDGNAAELTDYTALSDAYTTTMNARLQPESWIALKDVVKRSNHDLMVTAQDLKTKCECKRPVNDIYFWLLDEASQIRQIILQSVPVETDVEIMSTDVLQQKLLNEYKRLFADTAEQAKSTKTEIQQLTKRAGRRSNAIAKMADFATSFINYSRRNNISFDNDNKRTITEIINCIRRERGIPEIAIPGDLLSKLNLDEILQKSKALNKEIIEKSAELIRLHRSLQPDLRDTLAHTKNVTELLTHATQFKQIISSEKTETELINHNMQIKHFNMACNLYALAARTYNFRSASIKSPQKIEFIVNPSQSHGSQLKDHVKVKCDAALVPEDVNLPRFRLLSEQNGLFSDACTDVILPIIPAAAFPLETELLQQFYGFKVLHLLPSLAVDTTAQIQPFELKATAQILQIVNYFLSAEIASDPQKPIQLTQAIEKYFTENDAILEKLYLQTSVIYQKLRNPSDADIAFKNNTRVLLMMHKVFADECRRQILRLLTHPASKAQCAQYLQILKPVQAMFEVQNESITQLRHQIVINSKMSFSNIKRTYFAKFAAENQNRKQKKELNPVSILDDLKSRYIKLTNDDTIVEKNADNSVVTSYRVKYEHLQKLDRDARTEFEKITADISEAIRTLSQAGAKPRYISFKDFSTSKGLLDYIETIKKNHTLVSNMQTKLEQHLQPVSPLYKIDVKGQAQVDVSRRYVSALVNGSGAPMLSDIFANTSRSRSSLSASKSTGVSRVIKFEFTDAATQMIEQLNLAKNIQKPQGDEEGSLYSRQIIPIVKFAETISCLPSAVSALNVYLTENVMSVQQFQDEYVKGKASEVQVIKNIAEYINHATLTRWLDRLKNFFEQKTKPDNEKVIDSNLMQNLKTSFNLLPGGRYEVTSNMVFKTDLDDNAKAHVKTAISDLFTQYLKP